MRVVVDASVAVKWILQDPETESDVDAALDLLRQIQHSNVEVLQPSHWLLEVVAVVARKEPDLAHETVRILQAMALPTVEDERTLYRACRLADTLEHHLFDTLYHAVALEHDAVLWTADRTYRSKAAKLGQIRSLGAWSSQKVQTDIQVADVVYLITHRLTSRQAEIFELGLSGASQAEIADQLGVSKAVVRRDVERIEEVVRLIFSPD